MSTSSLVFLNPLAIALPTNESAKIARDTQIFLQNNTDLCNAIDPFGGAYYVESLTHQLQEKAISLKPNLKLLFLLYNE